MYVVRLCLLAMQIPSYDHINVGGDETTDDGLYVHDTSTLLETSSNSATSADVNTVQVNI